MVAVTGNSIEDSKCLSIADVGFSMGHEGCDVARENSSIVLLEDKFASLIEAIMWGREIHDCVRKLIVF